MSLSLCSVIYLIFVYFYTGVFFSAVFVYLIYMCNKVLLDIYVCSMLYAYTSKELYIFYSSKVMCNKALCFCTIAVAAGADAPLLLLLSTVLCACTVIIFLVVVITRNFESQMKSSGHAAHSQSF